MIKNKQEGIALISAILLSTVLLGISFGLATIFISKIKTSGQSRFSVTALYAAEAGVEWCIYDKNIGSVIAGPPTMLNGATYKDGNSGPLEHADCIINPIKVLGGYQGVTRAFEATF